MSTEVHDTSLRSQEQDCAWLDNQWEEEVVSRLPQELEAQAMQLGAWKRKREIASATDLLRGLLGYVLCAPSFRLLGAWALLIGLADICERAWRKRLWRANAWLLWLCGELIASPVASQWLREREVGRVLLVDATRIRHVGGTGDDWRLHTAYELCAGRLSQVSITDRHGGEKFAYYVLQAGDIVVADRGYGFRSSVAYASKRKAYVVLRFVLRNFPVEDEQGEAIDLLAWAEHSQEEVASRMCWSRWQGERVQVRVIIRRFSEEEARKAREQLRKKARKNGQRVSEQAWKAAGWLWLVTTLPAQTWNAQDVLRLYRARWQIELVYKRLKQLLKLGRVASKQREMVEATIRLRLIAWALQEEEANHLRAQLALVATEESVECGAGMDADEVEAEESAQCREEGQADEVEAEGQECEREAQDEFTEHPSYAGPISTWLLTSLCLDCLTQQVRGYWTAARLRACLSRLRRFCASSPRRRVHQETRLRAWLVPPRSQTAVQVTLLA
jgi:hypothetical protein